MCIKGKHADENNPDIIRLFNMDDTGHFTIQNAPEVLQILGWAGLRILLNRWNSWRYSTARAASSGIQWNEELDPEKDKNNNKAKCYEELNWSV